MYVDWGACADPVPNGAGGRVASEGSRSVRRGRGGVAGEKVGVEWDESFEPALGNVTIN